MRLESGADHYGAQSHIVVFSHVDLKLPGLIKESMYGVAAGHGPEMTSRDHSFSSVRTPPETVRE